VDKIDRWRFFSKADKVCFWVDGVLPLSVAHATIGESFAKIIDFTDSAFAITDSATIVGAVSEATGTTFELSVASNKAACRLPL